MRGPFERTTLLISHFKTAPFKDDHCHRPSSLGTGNHLLFNFFLQLDHTFPDNAGYTEILDTDLAFREKFNFSVIRQKDAIIFCRHQHRIFHIGA